MDPHRLDSSPCSGLLFRSSFVVQLPRMYLSSSHRFITISSYAAVRAGHALHCSQSVSHCHGCRGSVHALLVTIAGNTTDLGSPLTATILVEGIDHPIQAGPLGDYYRLSFADSASCACSGHALRCCTAVPCLTYTHTVCSTLALFVPN